VTDLPAIAADRAALAFGERVLWETLALEVPRGEFLAVLGPNGAGKTSLLRVLLGLQALTSGTIRVWGAPPRRGDRRIGYIAQYRAIDPDLPIRGWDMVGFGLDGHRFGIAPRTREDAARIAAALDLVGARQYAVDNDRARAFARRRLQSLFDNMLDVTTKSRLWISVMKADAMMPTGKAKMPSPKIAVIPAQTRPRAVTGVMSP
jgi:ABC-type multidrug transport system ATPase subunit